jgi:hypothetical protein
MLQRSRVSETANVSFEERDLQLGVQKHIERLTCYCNARGELREKHREAHAKSTRSTVHYYSCVEALPRDNRML